MKQILFQELLGEPDIIGNDENGYKIMRGNQKMNVGKDVIAHCSTFAEADELVKELTEIEKGSL